MTLTRTYALSPSSEGFQLYEGSNAAGILKFTSPTVSNPSTYTYTVCLSPVQHCVVMTDTNGDGWTPGSTLTVSIEGLDFGTFRLVKGYTSSGLFSLAGHLLPNSEWKYANVPQTTTEWPTASVSWNESYSFPDVTTISSYYSKSI